MALICHQNDEFFCIFRTFLGLRGEFYGFALFRKAENIYSSGIHNTFISQNSTKSDES